jgi:membrane protease YdiL (CAAX protease family)
MNTSQPPKSNLLVAWIVVILASSLPKVILQEIFGQTVSADQQAIMSLSVILVALLATLIWRSLRGLWPLLGLFTVLIGSQWLIYSRIDELSNYPTWLHHPSFNVSMLAEQSLNIMVTLLVISALLLMGKKTKDFYLAKGDIAAPVEPIRWLGVKEGDRWNQFGVWLSIFISLGTLSFLVIAGRPPLDIVIRALPFLPAILIAAALNAFTEEVTYKASFLSVLENPVGPRQALFMVAVYFGLGHFYGVPYGVVGVLLAAFMGWLLAKSMQETHGLFWAWFIHFLQDVWIFAFLAIGSIIPGGG